MIPRFLALPVKEYNLTKLDGDIRPTLTTAKFVGLIRDWNGTRAILTEFAIDTDETFVVATATAHVATDLTPVQEIDSIRTTKADLVAYLQQQVFSPTPDTAATIRAAIEAYAALHPRLDDAINNVAVLYGYNTGTNAGYLQAAYFILGIAS